MCKHCLDRKKLKCLNAQELFFFFLTFSDFEGKTESILMDLAQKHSRGEGHYWWKCVCWRTAKCILLSTVSVYMSWTPPGRLQPSHQGSESACLRDMLSKCHLSLSPDSVCECLWLCSHPLFDCTVIVCAYFEHSCSSGHRCACCMMQQKAFLIMKLNSIILDDDWKSRHTKSESVCL